jgi:hypothetical protein
MIMAMNNINRDKIISAALEFILQAYMIASGLLEYCFVEIHIIIQKLFHEMIMF